MGLLPKFVLGSLAVIRSMVLGPSRVPQQSAYREAVHPLFISFIKAATSFRREGRLASRIPQTTSSATEE